MKLLEKMAQEYSKKISHSYSIVQSEKDRAFQAGFRTAREMAAEIAAREESNTPYKILMIGESEAE